MIEAFDVTMTTEPAVKFSVRLPESLKRQLAEYAEKNRMTQREVIETALRALIEKPPRKKRWWRR